MIPGAGGAKPSKGLFSGNHPPTPHGFNIDDKNKAKGGDELT